MVEVVSEGRAVKGWEVNEECALTQRRPISSLLNYMRSIRRFDGLGRNLWCIQDAARLNCMSSREPLACFITIIITSTTHSKGPRKTTPNI